MIKYVFSAVLEYFTLTARLLSTCDYQHIILEQNQTMST
jgi:hypothetical protein